MRVPGCQHWCLSTSRGFVTFCCSHGQTIHHRLGEGSREAQHCWFWASICDGENKSNSWDFCMWPIHSKHSSAKPSWGVTAVASLAINDCHHTTAELSTGFWSPLPASTMPASTYGAGFRV